VLDLFSGSGALGLEALSRGAESCVFVERDPELMRLAQHNAEACMLHERCEFLPDDVLGLPNRSPVPASLPAQLVLVDPPYALVDDPNVRTRLFDALEALIGPWLLEDALLVLHHRPMPHALWPVQRLQQVDMRVYGRSQLTFFEASASDQQPEQ
jgi:16S rRNA (guanine966-N2)-methyltransferase